ncbi:zinc finger protein CONSTANS-LIKE 2-like [Tripterygium wilfordii]|uniref:Zinc finger protein CONSTANS-LIKE 2-like n=1 Tax=Tripterygium wilfordii TaxID=458696 RepID=A0A7J7D7E0_TRIWF|nr:B-box zinc finger protein 32-like [Tripterygium wilfordii]KAF5742221.1 zinc finger protein CONSTANS-LIKE 2-like [Tripterygium wilfordii]
MTKCELCNSSAKMYCESDQARLCWDCDAKVHGANFLVAKHSRTLLCHLCHSYTPWAGSGPKLTPTVSVCSSCINSCNGTQEIVDVEERQTDGDTDIEGDDEEEDEDSVISADEEEDDEEEDNQVVPGSSMPVPVDSDFSSSGDCPDSDEGAS